MRIKVGQFNVSDLGAWLAGNRSSSNDPSSASTDVPPSQLPLVHYDSMEQPATGPLGVDAEDPRRSRRGNHSDTGSFRAPTLTAGGAGSAVERPSAVPPLQPSRSAYGSLLHSQSSRRARLPLATSIRSQLTTRSHEAGTLLTSLFNTTEATMAQMVRTESHGDESRTSFSADDEHQDAQAPGYLRLWVINRAALHQRRKIASGGSGQVWEGTGAASPPTAPAARVTTRPLPAGRYNRTRVAIKELFSALMDPEALEEFVQEASLQSQLRHPNIGVCELPRAARGIRRQQCHRRRPHLAPSVPQFCFTASAPPTTAAFPRWSPSTAQSPSPACWRRWAAARRLRAATPSP